jgi:hypothetical protein
MDKNNECLSIDPVGEPRIMIDVEEVFEIVDWIKIHNPKSYKKHIVMEW